MALVALQILFWIIAVSVALLALALFTPLRVHLSFRSNPVLRSSIDISPFGGAVGQIRVFDSTRKRDAKKRPAARKKTRKKKAPSRNTSGTVSRRAIRDLPNVIGQMVRTVHVENLAINGEFGLNDPADTGQLYGQLTPFIYGAGCKIRVQPNFQSACLRGAVNARFRVIPIALLWPIAGFLWRIRGALK